MSRAIYNDVRTVAIDTAIAFFFTLATAMLASTAVNAQVGGESAMSGGSAGVSSGAGGGSPDVGTATGILSAAHGGTGAASLAAAGVAQTSTMSGAGVTCAAGAGTSALTLDIVCPAANAFVVVPLINSDADGCVVTMAETGAALGCVALIEVASTAGGTITIADVSNVVDVDGSWAVTAAGDNLTLVYADLANDQWQEIGRNKSWGPGTVLTDADVSDTLTCSIFKGSGTTTDAIDLATAEAAGTLPISKGGTNSATALSGSSLMVSNGSAVIQGAAGTATTVLHGAVAGVPTYGAVSLTADVTGVTPLANGGTGQTTFAAAGIAVLGGNAFSGNNTFIANDITDADVSDTLTCSMFVGSGSSTTAVDLATAEVAGILPVANGGTGASTLAFTDANISDTLTSSIFKGSGTTTDAVDLATAEVAGVLPVANGGTGATSLAFTDANISDTLTSSIFKGSGTTTDAVDLATAEVAGVLPVANGGTGQTTLAAAGILAPTTMSGSGVTCASTGNGSLGTLTLDPTCPGAGGVVIVPIINSDVDGCTVTFAETGSALGCTAYLHLVSSAGGVVTMANVANKLVLGSSAWTPAVGDGVTLSYEDLADDAWVERSRSNDAVGRLIATTYTTSGTAFVLNQQTRSAGVTLCSGGGGGGGAGSASAQGAAGSGGAGGSCCYKFYTGLTGGASETYSIGSGGAAGTSAPADGSVGNQSTFTDGVTTLTAGGVNGGVNMAAGTTLTQVEDVSSGNSCTNADYEIFTGSEAGKGGIRLSGLVARGGSGGGCMFGWGGLGRNGANGLAGRDGNGQCAGGSGATVVNNGGAVAGGAGRAGAMLVQEYTK